ncbi:hypothetical protein TrVE_jg2144 [Triparma verrucosa]|uniref:PPM-type phosphatase domain-containing protein n=1 Tax=Triparma verrucosa TaxID=1606542 RepID=A0A9W7B2R7_9STRA|nr:hypothetical protein TrVE_jg2144 [Triparma verrucosa]|mmetsp:Transcript_7654/g.13822  ORF Transcript_7654/g.13822 Transcript_7654/m.13822 type:complete len:271 (-) Transcript_7654:80-892(-)|eukprot:CAMPEP_0182492140 /NCGR_PEP_ID=MMETSP1321-20130603/1352_1 /TAXON_ID=91990 /ORGANISM="Bolidomonas sp., Strain RCC1657" /LENGTH=270 /DNA_ID=CAMNT_0024694545 /DNA_START=185 /DNA_END=997 /DNA_ORIENTATION=-
MVLSGVSDYEEMNPTKRNTMEDVHRVVPNFLGSADKSYLAVYDGHGGRGLVDFMETRLEQNIATEIRSPIQPPSENTPPPQSPNPLSPTLSAIERAYLLTDIQSRQAGIMASGATAVSCLVDQGEKKIYAANCGDARAVLCRKGSTLRLTHDHKADDPTEISRIESAGGFVLRNRVLGILAVARSFGDHGMKEFVISRPYLSETNLKDDDEFVVVACDGLWDVMSDDECTDLVKKYTASGKDVTGAAQMLVEESMTRGSTDNISVIVAWL